MSFDRLSNELIIYLGNILPNPSLNSVIRTCKICAILLTPQLYNPELFFKIEDEVSQGAELDGYGDADCVPPLVCLDCAPRWNSDIILGYFRAQSSEKFTLVDKYKRTILHHTAAQGNTDVLEVLLGSGANIEAQDIWKKTPLCMAAERGNGPVLRALLKAGANPRASVRNITVLVEAIFSKSVSSVQCILEALDSSPGDVWAPLDSGDTLHHAIYIGDEAIVRLLLERGANFQSADSYGTTCVTAAACWGYSDVVNLLLDYGADILPEDEMGRTALTEMGRLDETTIRRIVRAFVEAGGDISVGPPRNLPPLYLQAMWGNLPCIETLMDNGADPLADTVHGGTPLMCALLNYNKNSEADYEGVCRALIKAMASHERDVFPVHLMTEATEWEPERQVLGMTALHLAAEEGVEYVVRLLVETGADVMIKDGYGRTPFHCALRNGREGICLVLAEKMKLQGYDFTTRGLDIPPESALTQGTLLEYASRHKLEKLAEFLAQTKS